MPDKDPGKKGGYSLWLVALGVLALVLIFRPETFRTPLQAPVSLTVRASLVGVGNVVVVRNTSGETLNDARAPGRNGALNQSKEYLVGRRGPGQSAEVGWLQCSWKVAPARRSRFPATSTCRSSSRPSSWAFASRAALESRG